MVMEYRRLGKTNVYIPVIGFGTWEIGGRFTPDYSADKQAIEIIKLAINKGITFIDTAEVYGAGHSEEIVGEAIKEFSRDDVFIATKVWSSNLRYNDVLKAIEGSLNRLKIEYVDLYQIHWPNPGIPLRDTMKAMEKLVIEGKTRFIGVSNFSVRDMEEAMSYLSHTDIVSNQVLYNVIDKGIEDKILPFCKENNITVIAYRPLSKGLVAQEPYKSRLESIGRKYGKTAVQVAINWVLRHDNVVAIPRTMNPQHLEEILGSIGWRMSREDYEEISRII
ncbi:MAG: aldo/keto reductase [Thaumarchaeota archaeon]|jgi:diketogulonate reductase-like aldo/keto reductase|nr:aldo/keto reductase [Candidatus Geocrenenecus arthurdayi]MCL7389122.1 aldo/keto reductase [Candidatus Geocrenenecus arthurdayi]MCL7390744.1 aldo/keto reductase [Candidatus Geocrenenecus arthurdayi]MCL7396626.1 aldo/keto reductase [Candidatus Geocrenenecus arthurdayi]MCL7401589.1 aldo/keto reductase [Candidatus Geocrenenecus arthurdayi]